MNYEQFVRDRITQLRIERNVSEYQMSYDLGKSRGYIYYFSSGQGLPPLKELFKIIEYFGMTPAEFFNENPRLLIQEIVRGLQSLSDEDLEVILAMVGRLCVMREALIDLTANADTVDEPLKLK